MTATRPMNDLTMPHATSSFRSVRSPATRVYVWAFLGVWMFVGIIALSMGPKLGDHEVIVAQIARQTLETGDWVVPHYLDAPFLVKPPLSPWLIALCADILPHDSGSGQPVTEFGARIPSLLATLLTVFIVLRLAQSMYSRRVGYIAAFVQATAIGSLLFAMNATAEALLTLFCTWAFAEFWWSRQAATTKRKRLHQFRYYLALGLGMLAKGPMPLLVVCLPIAVWWWCERPTRFAASLGPAAAPRAFLLGLRNIWSQVRIALTDLGLWWGIPVFLLCFVPWMILVGMRESYAWSLWSYEYLDRARGDYPGADSESLFYYIPILFGLAIPWCLSMPEAMVAPFMRAYRRQTKPLLFAWFWVVVGFIVLSLMSFKKSYYVLPLLPGCTLLLAPVLDRLFFNEITPGRRAVWAIRTIVVIFLSILVGGGFILHEKYPWVFAGFVEYAVIACAVLALVGVVLACVLFLRSHKAWSLSVVGVTSFVVFTVVWCAVGPFLENAHDAIDLVETVRRAGVSSETPLHWASNRPDGRVAFYGGQPLHHVVDFYELIAEQDDESDTQDLLTAAADRADELLESERPTYLLFQRGHWHMFAMLYKPDARELCSVDRMPEGQDDHDWVVITNTDPS